MTAFFENASIMPINPEANSALVVGSGTAETTSIRVGWTPSARAQMRYRPAELPG